MIYATIPHLLDMCATSIVYKLWTRQDIYENWSKDNHWQLLENKVILDVKNLPLPELVKSRLLPIVKPAGRHFFGFLSVWLSKMTTSEKWLTRGMLSDCLIYTLSEI
ncbi:hypothetical protein AVEN_241882-1 [Araneus ventricosus]|uniref:Uncharacterized protein n=1 Tax=Araneus ventricosus TaxID=182803 RepID=A0A4Y2BPV0_ARAVE|nr:hypothetical protein AVEN_241882-1 [Araneus ventricosus]